MAARGAKGKKVEAVAVQATLDAVKNLDTAKVVSEVNNLQVTLQSTLADVSASITSKIQQMSTIDDAILLKQLRLKELFNIEAEAISLDDLKAAREVERLDWEKRLQARSEADKEQLLDLEKQRVRDQEEWDYTFEVNKQREESKLKSEVDANVRSERVRQATLQKDWDARELELQTKENNVAELKAQLDSFETRLKAEVSKAEAILGNTLKRQHEHEKTLLQKDTDSAKVVCDMRVKGLEGTIANMQLQIDDLKEQVINARNDSKEIATNALQANSDRRVADTLRQVMDGRNNDEQMAGLRKTK